MGFGHDPADSVQAAVVQDRSQTRQVPAIRVLPLPKGGFGIAAGVVAVSEFGADLGLQPQAEIRKASDGHVVVLIVFAVQIGIAAPIALIDQTQPVLVEQSVPETLWPQVHNCVGGWIAIDTQDVIVTFQLEGQIAGKSRTNGL